VDLDGTLFNHESNANFRWETFIPISKPNPWCVELINAYRKTHTIILLTARLEIYRQLTVDRLTSINIYPYQYKLHMYPGDKYKAGKSPSQFKSITIKKDLLPDYEILLAVDDDPANVMMIRSMGIMCLHC
jgi:hypothetical protein